MSIGSVLSTICCLNTSTCKGNCMCGLSRNQNIKLTYILAILGVWLISAFIIHSHSDEQQHQKKQIEQFHCEMAEHQEECIAIKKSTIDFSCLAFVHLLVLITMLPKTKHAKIINEGLWLAKFFLLALLILITEVTELAESMGHFMQLLIVWGSPLLYALMNIVFVDSVYSFSATINECHGQTGGSRISYICHFLFSIAIWISALALNIFSYFYNDLWVSIANSVALTVFLAILLLRIGRKANSFLVYGLMMLHVNLISFSLHDSFPSDSPNGGQHSLNVIEHSYRIFSFVVFLFLTLLPGANKLRTKSSTLNEFLALNTTRQEEDNRYVSSNKWFVYHYIMFFVVLCLPAVVLYDEHAMQEPERGFLNIGRLVWWGSALGLYLWAVLVTRVYPEQDLSELENYFKQFELN